MRSESIEINGCSFYCETSGSGTPVVLLHGFGWDSSAWDELFHKLAGDYRVIRYDLRGFGRSVPDTAAPYSHMADLAALLEKLDVHSANILGHSLGGYIAVDFVLEYPTMAESLILADPAISGFEWSPELVETSFVTPPRLANEVGVEAGRNAWLEFPPFNRAMSNPQLANRITQMVNRYSGWHWFNPGLAAQLESSAIQRLSEISCPTLVIVGGANHPDYLRAGEMLESGIRGAKKVVISDAEHALPLEKPDQFNEAVTIFLRSL